MSDFMRHNAAESAFTSSDSWVILSPIEQSIKRKIEAVGVPLKNWDIQINYGIKTGYNEAFIITSEKRDEILAACADEDERKRTDALIRPILRGRDIKRYGYEWADLWLIATFPSRHYDIELYPAVKDYLLSFGMERLEQTGKENIFNGEKIKARKKTNNKWFETQDSISYWDDFSKPKIAWAETMRIKKSSNERFPRFSFISIPFFTDKTCFICCGKKLEYLTCILNSSITRYQLSKTVSMMDNGGYLMQKIFIEQIRIPIAPLQVETRLKSIIESGISNINENTENEIDKITFDLFGFTAEEKNFLLKNIG